MPDPVKPSETPPERGDPGRQAVSNGTEAETATRDRLLRLGYLRCTSLPEIKDTAFFITQWRSHFKTIYGTQLRADFYLWHPHKHPCGLLIEHKYQETNGTTDQKLPYAVANLKSTGIPAMLVITGPAFRPGVRAWCKAQEDALLTVVTSSDAWTILLNRGLL
jgi:hypothetical protein